MKSCRFAELHVLSHLQRTARKIRFGPQANVFLGPNDTGKSSLIKTLYWTLGAEPAQTSDRWKAADVKALLRFSLDEKHYSILRDGSYFWLFDGDGHLIQAFTKTTSQLAPFLARLFNFKLQLVSQEGEPATPTPAFMYLPFYIDQDGGWASTWSSFSRLNQFKSWRRDTIEYHAGVKPNGFYAAKAEHQSLEHQTREPRQKRSALDALRIDVSQRLPTTAFAVDLDTYKKEIDLLLDRCRVLREAEDRYRHSLNDIETRRVVLLAQQDVVRGVEGELSKDYTFASRLPESVPCPICGETYTNGFAERFAIAEDEDRCVELEREIILEVEKLDEERRKTEQLLEEVRGDSAEAEALLSSKQGDVTLKQLIANEGRREVQTLIEEEAAALDATIGSFEAAMQTEKDKMDRFSSRDRKKEVVGEYQAFMHSALTQDLNVLTLPETAYRDMAAPIKATGSDMPRAVLAYCYAFLHLNVKYSTSTFFPIVIDAVNQQEQDESNLKRMLEFIRDRRPPDSQLILGVVDPKGVDFDGQVIQLLEKVSALQSDDYGPVADEMMPYFDATRPR